VAARGTRLRRMARLSPDQPIRLVGEHGLDLMPASAKDGAVKPRLLSGTGARFSDAAQFGDAAQSGDAPLAGSSLAWA
jgi:hypothetical protein